MLDMARLELLVKLKSLLENEDFKKILDVGGVQSSYDFLRKNFTSSKIFSINIKKSDLPKNNGILANAEELPFKKNYFDLVFAREVFEHLFRPDKFISEIERILKNDGKLILSTPNLNSWHVRLLILFGYAPTNYTPYPGKTYGIPRFFKTKPRYDHVRVFPYRALKEIFNSNDFVLEEIHGIMTFSENVWLKNWRKIIGKFLPDSWKEGVVLKAKIIK